MPPRPATQRTRPKRVRPVIGPEPEPDQVFIGGLMRCCLETIGDLYPDGPARIAEEGQTLQCKYVPDMPNHRMIFLSGAWQWDRAGDPLKR